MDLFENRLAMGLDEAALALSIPKSTLYKHLQRGDLVAKKLGRRTVIATAELRRYLDDSSKAGFGQGPCIRKRVA